MFGSEPFSSHMRISNIKRFRYDWVWKKERAANFLFMNKQPGKIVELASVFYDKQPVYNPQKKDNPKGVSKVHLLPNPSKISRNVRDVMGDGWKETKGKTNYFGKTYEPGKLLPNCLIEFNRDSKRVHPTQKPVALLEYLIKTYTNEGDTVLDPTMGSGSTGVACKNLGRKFIGIEMDAGYFAIAKRRIDSCNLQAEFK
jgi:site-specific DNA-methyltransferase (adenine-specific)